MEEPVYEAAPEPEPEPEPDYEDVGELDQQDEDAEGDYEDVLEPEDTPSLSYQAGEWFEWGGESIPNLGQQRRQRNLQSAYFLHVDVYISYYSGPSARAGGAGISAVALYDYQGGKFEAT